MKRTTVTTLLGVVTVVGALTLAGCANPVDAVVDRVLDSQGIDVDQKGGTVTIEGEDGEKFVAGGTEVPEDFPSELPLPEGKPTAAFSGGGSVSMTYEDVSEEEMRKLSDKIEALGYERVYDFTGEGGVIRNWDNNERSVNIIWDGESANGTLVYASAGKG